MRPGKETLPVVGQRADIEVPDGDGLSTVYSTWVQDVQPPRVTVAAPTVETHPVRIPVDTPVTLRYRDDRGMFTLRGPVVALQAEPPLATIEAREVSRSQNRKYFRWEARFPVRLVRRAEAPAFTGFDSLPPNAWRWGETRDISAGGLLLELTSPLDRGDLVMIELDLPGQKVEAEGQVVRVTQEQLKPDGPVYTLAGIEFTRICQTDQDRIVGFIFREQARLRKEGRL